MNKKLSQLEESSKILTKLESRYQYQVQRARYATGAEYQALFKLVLEAHAELKKFKIQIGAA